MLLGCVHAARRCVACRPPPACCLGARRLAPPQSSAPVARQLFCGDVATCQPPKLPTSWYPSKSVRPQAKAMIDEGRHHNAGRHFVVACGRRLIGAGRWLLSAPSAQQGAAWGGPVGGGRLPAPASRSPACRRSPAHTHRAERQ